jgi:hypothetical protein
MANNIRESQRTRKTVESCRSRDKENTLNEEEDK